MADELLTIATGPASIAVWKLGEWLISNRLKKAEQLERDVEVRAEAAGAEERSKLDELLKLVQRVEKDVALISRDLSVNVGAVTKVEERINGMSNNHGQRISQLERDVVELKTLVNQLLNAPRRRSK